MDMTGEYRIAAPRERVWAALNDPDVLRQCIPGCEEIVKVSDTEYTAKAKIKVGPVNARFAGRVTMTDMDPPAGYTIKGEGQGGAAGFGKGGARVALAEDGPDATILSYTAEAQVGGKLAQIGSRLVQGTAKKMADDFFACFAAVVAPGSAPVAPARDGDEETADEAATELLVETAEEVESRPEVPSSGMPGFASVPLVARPELMGDAEGAAVMSELAEPHHRVDDPSPTPSTSPSAGADQPAAAATPGVRVYGDASGQTGTTTAQGAQTSKGGLGPVAWIGLVAAVLLALILLTQLG